MTERVLADRRPGVPFPIRDVTQDISLDVFLKVLFGVAAGERFNRLKGFILRLTRTMRAGICLLFFFTALQKPYGPWTYFKYLQQKIDELLYAQIHDCRQTEAKAGGKPGTGILSLLVVTRDEDGNPMTDSELRDELMTLLLAGNETTANAAASVLCWVHRRPTVRDCLWVELQSLGTNPDPWQSRGCLI